MIRYNANSPEILGKKQYDVLSGIGWWAILFGFSSLMFSILYLDQGFWYNHVTINLYSCVFMGLCDFSGLYFITIGIGMICRWPKTKAIAFSGFFGILLLITLVILLFLIWHRFGSWWYGYSDNEFMFTVFIFCFCGLFWWGLIKYLAHPFVAVRFENRKSTSYVVSFPDPLILNPFEKTDPLQFYGGIWIVLGAVFSAIISYRGYKLLYGSSIIYENNEHIIRYLSLISGLLLTSIIGYGLSKHKEWARMLMMLFHSAIIILLICVGYNLFENTTPWEEMRYLTLGVVYLLFIAVMYWCYIVIRTLTSPVVKYVCLRGGHDID